MLVEKTEYDKSADKKASENSEIFQHLESMGKLLETSGGADFYAGLLNSEEPVTRNIKKAQGGSDLVPNSDHAASLQKVNDIFLKLKSANGRVNTALSELSDKYPVDFCVVEGTDPKSECRVINDGQSKRGVISLSEKTLEDSKTLPLVVARELGHYLDVVQRPDGCGELLQSQEHTADVLGVEMAANAGYSPQFMVQMLANSSDEFVQKRAQNMAQFAQLYGKTDLNRRLSEIPNTPGGRKVRNFIKETDAFFDEWQEKKKVVDDMIAGMSDERKLDYLVMANARVSSNASLEKTLDMVNAMAEKIKDKRGISLEQCRHDIIDREIKNYLYFRYAAHEINESFNPSYNEDLNKGYCTASVMSCLRKSDSRKELGALFDTDVEKLAHPATLFKHIMEMEDGKYNKHIYACDSDKNETVYDVLEKNNIQPGALICLTLNSGEKASLDSSHNHLMLYTGKDRAGEPCLLGFDNDVRDGKLVNKKIGYVCDTFSLTEEMIKDHHRNYLKNGNNQEAGQAETSVEKISKEEKSDAALLAYKKVAEKSY